MAKSSIHIQAGKEGYLAHNDRSQATVNSIFDDEKNEVWNNKKDAFKLFRFELAARSDAYTKRTNKKLHNKTITHLSSIVNFNKEHTMSDMRKVANYLENELGTKVFQIAMHRDEGHIDRHGKAVKNYHAHIEFMGLDQDGWSVRKKLTKAMLSQIQTDIADILNMERGITYAKELKPRPKRLDTYEYKAHKKEESKTKERLIATAVHEVKKHVATQKSLKEDIAKLKKKLQEQGAKRQQYAELEQLNRDLKQQIKNKDLTIEQMQQNLQSYADENITLKEQNQALKAKIDTLPSSDTLKELKTLKNDFEQEKESALKALEDLRQEFELYKQTTILTLERMNVKDAEEMFKESYESLINPKSEAEEARNNVILDTYEAPALPNTLMP